MSTMRKISIYGKGGVGKSIIASHVAAAMQQRGIQSALIGCSPKADSTYLLLGRHCTPTILDQTRAGRTKPADLQACVQTDRRGVICMETGGPEPASGCAGRGVAYALQMATRMGLIDEKKIQFAVFDVIADVVCGGFTEPMRRGYASEIYIVTSAELMSLYAANNVCRAVMTIRDQGVDIKLGGLIHNRRGIENEIKLVERFAEMINLPVLAHIPRSPLVQDCEAQKALVPEIYPEDAFSLAIEQLVDRIQAVEPVLPHPMENQESIIRIPELVREYGGIEALPTVTTNSFLSHSRIEIVDDKPERAPDHQSEQVAIYGKAGIGKSTVCSNVSVSLSELGERVMQVGCDPKHDSVALLTGRMIPTVLDSMHAAGKPDLDQLVVPGYGGVLCVESGGPTAGVGCAGQGVFVALEYLQKADVVSRYGITFILYDVLGDVVCGGFAQPIRGGFCRKVYVVTNGEPLSLFVTNNILKAMARMRLEGIPVSVAGIINNMRGVTNEQDIVERFADQVGVPVIAHVPRSPIVQWSEAHGKTVLEAEPNSDQANVYRELARSLQTGALVDTLRPLKGMEEILEIVGGERRLY